MRFTFHLTSRANEGGEEQCEGMRCRRHGTRVEEEIKEAREEEEEGEGDG